MPEEATDDFGFGSEAFGETTSFETIASIDEPAGDSMEAEAPAAEFEWNSVNDKSPSDPSASFADLSDDALEAGNLASGYEATLEGAPVDDEAHRAALMQQELESVDFYINQGYTDIAADTLDLMQRQFGANPEIESRRKKLKAAISGEAEVEGATVAPAGNEFELSDGSQLVTSEEVSADLDFAFAGVEAGDTNQFAPAVPEMKGLDAGLAEIFEEFRVAAEEEPAPREDFETHYNMGTAYKEMDLLDDAIREFQTAAGLTLVGDGTARYLQCCNMLGHCFMQKGLPRAAVLWFKKGLDSPGHGEEEYKAMRFELGVAYEQMGDMKRARDLFTEVYGMDVSYRGVGEKLQELEMQKLSRKGRKVVKS